MRTCTLFFSPGLPTRCSTLRMITEGRRKYLLYSTSLERADKPCRDRRSRHNIPKDPDLLSFCLKHGLVSMDRAPLAAYCGKKVRTMHYTYSSTVYGNSCNPYLRRSGPSTSSRLSLEPLLVVLFKSKTPCSPMTMTSKPCCRASPAVACRLQTLSPFFSGLTTALT